jgi:glycerol dehydrogenase
MDFAGAVGLPTTLSQLGLDGPDIAVLVRIAERSLAEGKTAHNEPFEVSTGMLVDAIVAPDALGDAPGRAPSV